MAGKVDAVAVATMRASMMIVLSMMLLSVSFNHLVSAHLAREQPNADGTD
jgi:hypothetical protein